MKKIDKTAIDARILEIEENDETQGINKTYPEISVIKYVQDNNLKTLTSHFLFLGHYS